MQYFFILIRELVLLFILPSVLPWLPFKIVTNLILGLPSGGSDGKVAAYNAGDLGLVPGSGRSPGEGNGTPLQFSCLENSMDRGAW